MNALGDGKAGGIDSKDGEIGELIAVGVEELVVVNVTMPAENPATVGTQIRLRRLTFDLVVQRLLAFVRMRQVELVGKKQACGEHCGRGQHGREDAVDAGSGR